MENYKIIFKKSVYKDIRKIEKTDLKRILKKIHKLSKKPRPIDCEKLSSDHKYRIRQENYRVLYEIKDSTITIIVVKIAHRSFVYKKQ